AGNVFLDHIRASNAHLIPVDSEHSAAFQALAGAERSSIEKIVLTASGGPFRTWTKEQLEKATPEEALRHPNWSMGAKITIDSATLMNKGLELIEAFHLFPVAIDQLDTIIHPQSIVHCLVHYIDGAIIAQLGPPDMRTPIAYALSWPHRRNTPISQLDLTSFGSLTFESVNNALFPAPNLAKNVLKRGGNAATILNAVNEIAVQAFLKGQLSFLDITRLVHICLERAEQKGLIKISHNLDDVLSTDQEARKVAQSMISQGI
ncbi:MAG: 1-deoxy-D-xylulose-5-phosphate reductoisomerase, partial [Hyphomicrobium sp.]